MANSRVDTKGVKEKRHYPQSYYTYREKNPTISIKLTKQTKVALDKVRGKTSYSEFLKSLVVPGGAFSRLEKLRAQLASERAALEKEKKELDKIERFVIPCPSCDDPLVFDNYDENYWNEQVKPRLEKAFSGFDHEGDPEMPRNPPYLPI
jgi:hypothetical protein